MRTQEQWLPLPGYAGRYCVSSHGNVRLALSGAAVKSRRDKDGYRMVTLWDFKKYHTAKVHRLVLFAFVGEPPPGCLADHINRDRSDNRAANLRWVTNGENNRNRSVAAASGVKGVRFRPGKPKPWQAYCYTNRFVSLGHFVTIDEAAAARQAVQI